MYAPNNQLYLISCDLVKGDENSILFSSKTEQQEYFMNHSPKWVSTWTTYIKDGKVRVQENINDLYEYNYLMYNNAHFTTKWFYCFIDRLEYVNENVTDIYFSTDVLQTWYFDFHFKKSYVERQHYLLDDYTTIADTVATGKLIERESKVFNFSGAYFVFCTNDVTTDDTSLAETYSFKIGNYSIPCMVMFFTASEHQGELMGEVLQKVANNGRADRILNAVFIPFIGDTSQMTLKKVDSDVGDFFVVTEIKESAVTDILACEFSTLINPSWKKLMTAPYTFIRVTDMTTGQFIDLDYAKFKDRNLQFKIQTTISDSPSYKIIPMNYEGQDIALNNMLVVNCSTSLPVINNVYASYMMKNSEMNNFNRSVAKANSIMGVGGNLLSGNVGGAINSGLSSYERIQGISMQESQMAKESSQVTGFSDGAQERLTFRNGIKVSVFSVDDYNKYCIENFWKQYGYPVHALADINHEVDYQNHCYTKVISPNIKGDGVPQNDLQEISSLYEKGITWWKKDYFKEY